MKFKGRRITGIILALAMVFTMMISMPVMAEDETQGGQETVAEAGDQTVVMQGSEDQSGQGDQGQGDQGQGDQGSQTQPEDPTGDEPAPEPEPEPEPELTPAQKEAAAIAKYGTYSGPNAKKIPILTYHNVVSDAEKKMIKKYKKSNLVIARSKFEAQMAYLAANGYRTISCEEFYLWHQGKILLPKRTVMITFDDGLAGVVNNALPVLQQYGFKGTSFIIGASTYSNHPNHISMEQIREIQKSYPNLEFQSHTFGLHRHYNKKNDYALCYNDALTMKSIFGFDYVAYPYGKFRKGMINAYRDAGVKMAFSYGSYGRGPAKRSQNIYKIKRLKVAGNCSMKAFKKMVK